MYKKKYGPYGKYTQCKYTAVSFNLQYCLYYGKEMKKKINF